MYGEFPAIADLHAKTTLPEDLLGTLRTVTPADRERLTEFMARHFGAAKMAGHDRLYDIPALPGFIAEREGGWVGNLAYEIDGPALEIAWVGALAKQGGVGSALIAACAAEARDHGLSRIWLITTNDNLDALRFYQRRGFRITAIGRDAANRAREHLKPEIPAVGSYDIPVHDEIHLELPRGEWDDVIARYSWPIA